MSKSENVMEKFIDKNIAELCMQYDKIRGANVNIARITPELIDGLKPVQRRALYIMFLKDHGKSFRKLATISGDTFGRIHPHCLHGDTEFILTNGTKMTIRDMYESGQAEFEVLSYVDKVSGVTRATMKSIRITKHVDSIYNIRFTNGYSVKCTNDHSILVMREIDNDFIPCWIKAEDIHPGDLLYSGEISNLSFEGVDVGIDIDRLLNDLKYSFIQVESVSIEKFNNPLPVYDFTVDGYENAVAYAGGRSEIDHSFIVLHNSPTSVTDAIIGIEQPWHNTIPLVEGKGNWGGVDGSPAGADRYISARLSEYSQACFFDDWNNAVVDMTMGYDDETKEPLYLPAKYPNVLINGCLGIG